MRLINKVWSSILILRLEVLFLGVGYVFLAHFLSSLSIFQCVLLSVFAAIGLQGATNSIAEYYDEPLDKISRPYSQVVMGIVNKRWAISQGIALYVLSLVGIAYFFNSLILLIAISTIAIAIAYSVPPTKLKSYGLIGTLGDTLPFSLVFLMALVATEPLNGFKLLWLTYMTLNLYISTLCKDFKDYKAEMQLKIRTPPVLFGYKRFSKVLSILVFLPELFVIFLILLNSFPSYYFLAVIPLVILKLYLSILLRRNPLEAGLKIFYLAFLEVTFLPYLYILLHLVFPS